jgi:hypothetical protein
LTLRKRGALSAAEQLKNCDVVEWLDLPVFDKFERFNSMAKPGYLLFYQNCRRWIKHVLAKGQSFDLIHQLSPLALRYPSPAANFDIPYILGPWGGSLPTPLGFIADCLTSITLSGSYCFI